MKRLNYSITINSAIVFIDGEVYTLPSSLPEYNNIIATLTDSQMSEESKIDSIRKMSNIKETIESYAEGRITIDENSIKYKGEEIPTDVLYERIVQLRKEGGNFKHLIHFLDNLMENPDMNSRKDLYRFLSKNNLPITSRGTFLAYKKVREDYTDIYSGKFTNSPGSVIEMDRGKVDPDRNNTCSAGFHAASYDYIPQYGINDTDKVVIVEINPRDVVSVPIDHDDAKLRTCRYEVIGEMDNPFSRLKSNFIDTDFDDEDYFREEGFEEEDNYFDDYYKDEEEEEEEWDGEFEPYSDMITPESTTLTYQKEFVEWVSNGVKKSGYIIEEIEADESLSPVLDRFLNDVDHDVRTEKVLKVKPVSSINRYLVEVVAVDDVMLETPVLYVPAYYQIDNAS